MSRLISLGTIASSLLAMAVVGACDASSSTTELVPEGPPMVRQILMTEVYQNTAGAYLSHENSLAFGSHPDPTFMTDDRVVNTALAAPTQRMRVIIDELLVGNNLEEIACKAQVDEDAYSRVPLGTTPDDIANCAGTQDVLDARCHGVHAVCLNNTGSPVVLPGVTDPVPVGGPVGILDNDPPPDGDGVSDSTRFIDGAVRVSCVGKAGDHVEAPMDLTNSYWQPSGNQQVPANGGIAVLGPALVLVPRFGLPTEAKCSLSFDASVVDHDGNRVCAPPDGDVTQNCPADGDTSLISFGTETLRVKGSTPVNGAMNVQRVATGSMNKFGKFTLDFNVLMDVDSLKQHVTILENDVPTTLAYNVVLAAGTTKYEFQFPGTCTGATCTGFPAATTFKVTVTNDVTDYFHQPYRGEPFTFTFTTAN